MKYLALITGFLLFAGKIAAQPDPVISDKIEIVWETSGLDVPESVLPDLENGILYVSNIGSKNPAEKEGNGFISILDTDGNIKKLKWCTGLNSPKGMAISNGKLYVSEVDKIGEIDLATGNKTREYKVAGAQFLNDITADPEGDLYITDSGTGTVHVLSGEEVAVFVHSDDFPGPNGLIAVEKALFLGTGDRIVMIDLQSKKVSDFMLNTGAVDGITLVSPTTAVFSDWPGTIHLMEAGSDKELLFDSTSSETSKTADFGYNPKEKLLYVPTFFGNSIVCLKLSL